MAMCDLPREVCVRLLTFLPLDSRAACAVLSRTLRDAAADDSLWRSLSFDGVRNSRVTPAALRSLLQRAGSRLRRLNIAALENKVPRAYWEHSVVENVLYALRETPTAAATLEELDMLLPEERELLQGAGVKSLRHLAFTNFALPFFAAMPALGADTDAGIKEYCLAPATPPFPPPVSPPPAPPLTSGSYEWHCDPNSDTLYLDGCRSDLPAYIRVTSAAISHEPRTIFHPVVRTFQFFSHLPILHRSRLLLRRRCRRPLRHPARRCRLLQSHLRLLHPLR